MAKSKIPAVKDLMGHFFMSIKGNHVDIVYNDNTDNGIAIGAAFASVLEEDETLFNIMSAAFMTALESREKKSNWEKVKISPKEKSISKTAKKVDKKPTKAVNKK